MGKIFGFQCEMDGTVTAPMRGCRILEEKDDRYICAIDGGSTGIAKEKIGRVCFVESGGQAALTYFVISDDEASSFKKARRAFASWFEAARDRALDKGPQRDKLPSEMSLFAIFEVFEKNGNKWFAGPKYFAAQEKMGRVNLVELPDCMAPLCEVAELGADRWAAKKINSGKITGRYLRDDARERIRAEMEGGKYLMLISVTSDTPCGHYWCWYEKGTSSHMTGWAVR